MDRLRQGAVVMVYRTRKEVCPVISLLRFMDGSEKGRGRPILQAEGGQRPG